MIHTYLFELYCIVAIVFVTSHIWFYLRVLRPIQQLSHQAERLKTGQLDSFEQEFGGIAEIRQLQRAMAGMCGHVRRAQKEKLTYHHALTAGQEAERARIARELHDDTVQSLIAIAQSIELTANWVEAKPDQAVGMLKSARTQAVESVENLRRLIGNLRPPTLEELGLIPALKMLAKDINGIGMTVSVDGPERRLDEVYELALFRSAQEAVHNALKHSGTECVHVEVTYAPAEVHLIVRDDGRGFAVPEVLGTFVEQGHYGLIGVVERIESLKGQVQIDSAPDEGTSVTITLPLNQTSQPGETVRDPVCHADIHPHQAYDSLNYEGKTYYFCCPVCQGTFQRDPETYVVS
jgi:signal transduction histidine kinase/YHS domain-containing protein